MIVYTSNAEPLRTRPASRVRALLESFPVRVALAVLLLVAAGGSVFAAPQAELWPRWEAHDADSTARVDHAEWAAFLADHLVTDHPSGVNLIDYGAVPAADRNRLDAYVAYLEDVPVSSLNRDEQLAYWINLYNAATVKLILDNYPVDSIRDIRPGVFATGPWDMELLEVEGIALTLNDVEHRIIRPIWQDNRIHYVVNCASTGCPNLHPEPITPANRERVFDAAARAYVNHPRGVRFEGSRLVLSSIFEWYVDDFSGDLEGVVDHLVGYVDSQTAERLRAHSGRVQYEYDWSLNEP